MNRDKTIAVTSDWHGNFKYGLMNPNVILYDEDEAGNLKPYSPKPTATQEYLWHLHVDRIIPEVKEYSKGTDLILLSLGDPTHGNHFMNELVSTRQGDQIEIALSNFMPWYELSNLVSARFAIGTENHEFGEGTATHLIANSLAREFKNIDTKALNYGLANINGVTISFAHHGPGAGSRVWLEGNTATWHLRSRMMDDIMRGKKPPDLYLYGHVHTYVNVLLQMQEYESRLIICPSMCVMSGFARKATKSNYIVQNGVVLFRITADGQLSKPHTIIEELDLRTKEVL